jgi:hypothetical protein
VNFQQISSYLEYAPTQRFSAFIDVPMVFIHPKPEDIGNTQGVGDINAGVKYAFLYSDTTVITGQMRVYAPTGDVNEGLGTGHVSLEPGLLAYQALSNRARLEGEFKDWIPIGGTDFAGNVLEYGLGLSYDLYQGQGFRVTPVVEFVGWTALSGKELLLLSTHAGYVKDASGDTIVNGKFGARFFFGEPAAPGLPGAADLYVGYGQALTGDRWYKDLFRTELRFRF